MLVLDFVLVSNANAIKIIPVGIGDREYSTKGGGTHTHDGSRHSVVGDIVSSIVVLWVGSISFQFHVLKRWTSI